MVPQAECKPMVDRIVTFKLSLAKGARDRMVQSKGLLGCKAFGKEKERRALVPFIINITMEINFSSKVYSKSLLKGSPLSCTSLEEVISCPEVWRPIF